MEDATFRNGQYQVGHDCILARRKAARYLICSGKEITIDPSPQISEARIGYRLLRTPLIALLYQRGRIVLHGSAIGTEKGAVVFMGQSGRGKSTLAAAFREKQYPLLTDDVCVLSLDPNGNPRVFPGYPQVKMHQDTARHTGVPNDALKPLPAELEIGKYTLQATNDFAQSPLSLHSIFEFDAATCDEISLTPLRGFEKQFALMRNTFLLGLVKGLGRESFYFQQYAKAFGDIPLNRLR